VLDDLARDRPPAEFPEDRQNTICRNRRATLDQIV
jgi:hypothetical protein